MQADGTTSTRERLLTQARRLFAERGYGGTSVGAIEEAAGLAPRRGALYKHFPTKEALLTAVVAEHTESIERVAAEWKPVPGDPVAQFEGLARASIAEMRSEQELTRIVMKEGDQFPELAAAFGEAIVLRAHRTATEMLEKFREATGAHLADPAATATVLCDSLVGFTLNELLFGPAPGGVDEDRMVAAWAETALLMIKGATT